MNFSIKNYRYSKRNKVNGTLTEAWLNIGKNGSEDQRKYRLVKYMVIIVIIGVQDHNRRFKLIFEFGLGKGFAPTRLIISIFHRLIGQYFESGILFISLANLHGGKR